MIKYYMYNPVAALENESHKLLRDFNIETDHLISARRPDFIIIQIKNVEFSVRKNSTFFIIYI